MPLTWLINQLIGTMSQRAVFANNAANLYTLLGLNTHAMAEQPMLAAASWGFFGASYLFCCAACLFSKGKYTVLLTGSTLNLLLFAFATQMTERYAFPGIILLMAFAMLTDSRLCGGMAAASAFAAAYNIFAVLHFNYIDYGNTHLTQLCCILSLLVAVGMTMYTANKCFRRVKQ